MTENTSTVVEYCVVSASGHLLVRARFVLNGVTSVVVDLSDWSVSLTLRVTHSSFVFITDATSRLKIKVHKGIRKPIRRKRVKA